MVIMITDRCGLCCPYCLVDTVSPDGEHMSETDFNLSIELARRLKETIIILAGGEPFEHPLFMKFVEYVKELGFWLGITTNGNKLLDDQDAIEYFLKLKGSKVQITMHTITWNELGERQARLQQIFLSSGKRFNKRFSTKKKPKKFFPSLKARKNFPQKSLNDHHYCCCLRNSASLTKINPNFERLDPMSNTIRNYNASPGNTGCSIHVHRNGTLRAGPSSFCQELGDLQLAVADFEEWSERTVKTLDAPFCGKCSTISEKEIADKDREFFEKIVLPQIASEQQ